MGTLIAWTHETWNPVSGCSHASAGCDHCYAETLSRRFGWSKSAWTGANAKENVVLKPHRLTEPKKYKPGIRVFVNSMSDLFHPLVPDDYIAEVFRVMRSRPDVTFQILTKRAERAAKWGGPWLPNIWMGTTVEDWRVVKRIAALRSCGAHTKFLSCEPLIGALGPVDLTGIDWVIAGGESGMHLADAEKTRKAGNDPCTTNPRWMRMEWARELRDACAAQNIAYFYKQDSGIRTEMRPWLIEEDGTCTVIQQYPGHMIEPYTIDPHTTTATRIRERTQAMIFDVLDRPMHHQSSLL